MFDLGKAIERAAALTLGLIIFLSLLCLALVGGVAWLLLR